VVAYLAIAALFGLGMSSLLGAPLRYFVLHSVPPADRGAGQGVLGIFLSSGMLLSGVAAGMTIASGNGGAEAYRNIYLLASAAAAVALMGSLLLKNPPEAPET
jgi:MFS family permease